MLDGGTGGSGRPSYTRIVNGRVGLAEAARAAGVPESTMRRRLVALHHQRGGGVLAAFNEPGRKVRKWWVNLAVLEEASTGDLSAVVEDLGDADKRIADLEAKLLALRNAHLATRRRLAELERRLERALMPIAVAAE